MREVPRQFVREPIGEAGEEGGATGEDDIADEDLAEFGVAGAEGFHDEGGDGLGEVGVGGLWMWGLGR